MDRWPALALSLLAACSAGGCIEFVDDGGDGLPREDGTVLQGTEDAAFSLASREERKVRITLVAAGDRHPYAMDDGSVQVTVDGLACTGLLAAGDAVWDVGDDVIVTPVTEGCGGRMQSGVQVTVAVRLFGDLAHEGVVTVR